MNKYRIENTNSNNELDCKSSSTLRTNPARRKTCQGNSQGIKKGQHMEGKQYPQNY